MSMTSSQSVNVANPSEEPLTLVEAKKHLEIAAASTVHDDHLNAIIEAARQVWERDTSLLTTSRTIVESFHEVSTVVELSRRPVQSVTSVVFDGTTQTGWSLDAERQVVELETGHAGDDWNSVQVTYVAGFATVADVPEVHKYAMKLQIDLMFQPQEKVPHHQAAYENMVTKYLRSSYP